ncbi:GAF domain-containing sensor histidine kinase [Asticcacaulis sp. EMRT-3]|uniref:sensor histidine kinase n=1 Tax=Asticcacaulis sp. EMRT-3 TaxID=3040349 RepID=UPI0024AE9685|nr:GAF domain-containing sensor histidine kinase [Asticcacaulis sp. EMRT-3]MDI7776090.1 GAF domain-containing sensor histidine kinase [Asticcacaulis sp. EMRT-3]
MTQSPDDSKLAASVCQLAMAIFDLPGAVLKLYEGERLITIGAAGMAAGLPDHLAFSDDRNLSEGLCVADAARDSRFFLEPVVLKAQGVRFYADAPLLNEGHVIGLLSVFGDAPRHDFDARRQALLSAVADIAAVLMTAAESARDREMLQAALAAQTARLDRAATLTHFGYWTIDLASRQLHWSDGLYALYGRDRDSFMPSLASHFDIFGAAAQEVVNHVQRAVADGADFDFTLDVGGENPRLLRTRGGVEYDVAGGLPARICAVVCAAGEQADAPAVQDKASLPHDEPLMRFTQELRHPLKGILEAAQAEHPDVAAYSEGLRASAEALQDLIGESVEAGDPGEPPVHVAEVIQAAVEPFVARARAFDTRLNLHFVDFNRTQARLDVMRLEQVLQNLIGNACQFTRGGVISVTASQVQAENPVNGAMETRLHVSVRDSGPGMSETEAQSRLNGHMAGAGLGLSVARTIVELLDGHIGIHAQPGEGTHVWFEIPLIWADTKPARPRHLAPDPVLTEPKHAQAEAPLMRGPAYLPRQAAAQAAAPIIRSAPVDADRINREYLRALLQDMKLGLS